MYGGMVGAYLNSNDLSGGDDYKINAFPQINFGPGKRATPWTTPGSVLRLTFELQVPTSTGFAWVVAPVQLRDRTSGIKLSYGPRIFHNYSKPGETSTQPLPSIKLDGPSNSWMIREHLVPAATWSTPVPGSQFHQRGPWLGWQYFGYTISYAQMAAALKVMHQKEPQLTFSSNPGDYEIQWFHLNAEGNYETAPVELGWSMRNFQIWNGDSTESTPIRLGNTKKRFGRDPAGGFALRFGNTPLRWDPAVGGTGRLDIYDVHGRRVRSLGPALSGREAGPMRRDGGTGAGKNGLWIAVFKRPPLSGGQK
jgi:hypothetical protein